MLRGRASTIALFALATGCAIATEPAEEPRRNWFNDPSTQATNGMSRCPVPGGPLLTFKEQQREAHQRRTRDQLLAGR